VLLGLGLLAVPLRKLTSAENLQTPARAPAVSSLARMPAVLRLRLLAAAERVVVKTAQGGILLDLPDLPAGESEHDAFISIEEGALELAVEADLGNGVADSALFLTVMPDGYESETRYMIGQGPTEEILFFRWHTQ
jgi:hypothetical protein